MKTVAQMLADREILINKGKALFELVDTDNRDMTDEETAELEAINSQIESLNSEISKRQKFESAIEPTFETPVRRTQSPQPDNRLDDTPIHSPTMSQDKPRIIMPVASGRMKAFENTREGRETAHRCGMWLAATVYGNQVAADWCRNNGVDVRSALSGGVNTAGGVLVPEEFENAVIDLRAQYGIFRQYCRVRPMGSDTLNIPRKRGGLTAYHIGENKTGTESDQNWDNVTLSAKKGMVLTLMSSEISEDAAIDLANDMAMDMADAFALMEDNDGFLGDGSSTYGGITGIFVKALQSTYSTYAVHAAASTHDTIPEIDSDDLLGVMAKCSTRGKRNAAWYCGPTSQELIFNAIKIAGGGNTRDNLASSDRPMFLGYPIIVSELLPDSATTNYNGAAILGFGDLSLAATMGSRRGIRIALSTDRYFELDQIGVKATERFDINVHDLGSSAEIVNQSLAAKSPFVVLTGTT